MSKEQIEQIKRVRQMETLLNRVSIAVKRLSAALDKYEEVQDAIAVLNDYYGGDLWRNDFVDDEAGLLPNDLKRGVLSEDAVWNLLSDYDELNSRLQEFADTNKKNL